MVAGVRKFTLHSLKISQRFAFVLNRPAQADKARTLLSKFYTGF